MTDFEGSVFTVMTPSVAERSLTGAPSRSAAILNSASRAVAAAWRQIL